MESQIVITDHAYQRAKERLRWKPNVLAKMAEKAFATGVNHSDAKGLLKKYITKLWHNNKNANNIIIHSENIFFFSGNVLITIYQLPQHLKKYAIL